MNSMMLDIETLGTRPRSTILSVGAVMFDPCGTGTGAEYYVNVTQESCMRNGMLTDADTVRWWGHQDRRAARDALKKDQVEIDVALYGLCSFFRKHGGVHVWGHGSCFDVVLVEEALRLIGVSQFPWDFRAIRDTRTLFDCSGFDLSDRKPTRAGTYHHALDDAKYQVRCVQAAVSMIGDGK